MKAAVLKEFGKPLVVEDVPVPEPGPDEVLVQVKASGLCMTDVHIQEGLIDSVELPYIPGHEMAGVVVKPGSKVTDMEPGQHVVCGIDITCGKCSLCLGGHENLCLERVRIGFERNGSHAEYAAVPRANLYPISKRIPFEQACIIPDAVACMHHAIMDVGKVRRGDCVLVHGIGGLGLQGIQILKGIGAKILAAGRTQAKLDIALAIGADYVVNTSNRELSAAIDELTAGKMCDVVLELAGCENAMDLMLKCVRPGGKIVALGYAAPRFYGDYQELVLREKQILGVRGATRQNMLEAIALVEKGAVVPVVTGQYQLAQINEALGLLKYSKGLGRNVIVFK